MPEYTDFFLFKLLPVNTLLSRDIDYILSDILVAAIIIFALIELIRFKHKIATVYKPIFSLSQELRKHQDNATQAFENIKDLFSSHELVRDEWDEYEHTLIKRDNPRRVFKTESSEVYFNENRLFSKKLNIRYWHALPGILVGLGIFGTFMGLSFGLSKFDSSTSETMKASIQVLLSGMTAAFSTSVWGMFFSIFFNWYEKRNFNRSGSLIASLNKILNKMFTLTTQEEISMRQQEQLEIQTTALQVFSTDLADRIKIAMDTVMASRLGSLQEVVEKMYKDGENSTKLLIHEIKSSGDVIAEQLRESVGQIMVEKLSPSLEQVSNSINSLVPIVQDLRSEKQSSTEETIRNIVEEFKNSLSGTTKKEMENLAQVMESAGSSLSKFPEYVEGMLYTLNNQSMQIKQVLEQSSNKVNDEMERRLLESERFFSDMLNSLREQLSEQHNAIQGATKEVRSQTEKTILDFGVVIEGLQDNVKQLLNRQEDNAAITEDLINNSKTILSQGSELTENVNSALRSIVESIGQINGTSNSLSSTAEKFTESTGDLKDVLNELTAEYSRQRDHVNETTSKLFSSLDYSKQLLSEYSDKFKVIESGIAEIFKQIQDGLGQYSNAVRENLNDYLSEFSTNLSDAAKQLSGAVEYLQETVDELSDNVSKQ